MKNMKKIFALVLVALLALGMTAALAHTTASTVTGSKFTYEGTDATSNGSIKVTNATKDVTYTLYKIFDATYNTNGDVAYTMKSTTAWDSDFSQYFKVSTQADSNSNYAVTRAMQASPDDDKPVKTDAELFAYLKGKTANFTNIGAIKASADGEIEWEMIPYGYYIIVPDTPSSGAAVTINSAVPTVNVIDKNQGTTYDKAESVDGGTNWAYEDEILRTDEALAASNTPTPSAKVGDTVNYKIEGTWTRYIGEDYMKTLKFHDVMTSGLTADQNVSITFGTTVLTPFTKKVNGVVEGTAPANSKYTVNYVLNNNNTTEDATDDYWETFIEIPVATVSEGVPTFLYAVTNSYTITYSAKIDKDAVIDGVEINTVDIKYDDKNDNEHEIGTDKTKVENFKFQLVKLDGDDKALTGAEFKLWADNSKSTQVRLVEVTEGVEYRVADATETSADAVIKAGKPVIKGLKKGVTYYLEETKAPDGYNKLENLIPVTLNNGDNLATFYLEAETKPEGKETGDYKEGGVKVNNLKGTELPSTGGIGTTIFYVAGGILVLAAVILLVTKRRMNAND